MIAKPTCPASPNAPGSVAIAATKSRTDCPNSSAETLPSASINIANAKAPIATRCGNGNCQRCNIRPATTQDSTSTIGTSSATAASAPTFGATSKTRTTPSPNAAANTTAK